jgi:hypothetical protein
MEAVFFSPLSSLLPKRPVFFPSLIPGLPLIPTAGSCGSRVGGVGGRGRRVRPAPSAPPPACPVGRRAEQGWRRTHSHPRGPRNAERFRNFPFLSSLIPLREEEKRERGGVEGERGTFPLARPSLISARFPCSAEWNVWGKTRDHEIDSNGNFHF